MTVRASVADNEAEAAGASTQARVNTLDGRYVAFVSSAPNLVPGYGITTHAQVYRRDLVTGETILVSKNFLGFEANADCANPSISSSGQWVVYSSDATNLSGTDSGLYRDVFRCDITTGATLRISEDNSGVEGNGVSNSASMDSTGNLVVFRSFATNLAPGSNGFSQVLLRNVTLGTTVLVSKSAGGVTGDGDSGGFQPTITPNGRYVGFSSRAGNLVSGDTNGNWDVYLCDLQTNSMKRVSLPTNGAQYFGISHTSAVSDNGRYVAFASINAFNINDTNNTYDVFLRDTVSNTLTRVSNTTAGKSCNGASGDSEGWGICISGDGLSIAFESLASNLVKSGDNNGFEDVFVKNLSNGKTTLVSVATNGVSGNGASFTPSISSNGYISFVSDASNLISGDTLGYQDVFVRGPAR